MVGLALCLDPLSEEVIIVFGFVPIPLVRGDCVGFVPIPLLRG